MQYRLSLGVQPLNRQRRTELILAGQRARASGTFGVRLGAGFAAASMSQYSVSSLFVYGWKKISRRACVASKVLIWAVKSA